MSSVNTQPINMNIFTQLADQASQANRDNILSVSGGKISTTGTGTLSSLFISSAAKREAIETFVKTLRQEYGSHIASLIKNSDLNGLWESGKPLTARMVKDLTLVAEQEKARVNAHNQGVVNKFLDGTDPQNNFNSAIDKLCADRGITSPEDIALVRDTARTRLESLAATGGFHPSILTDKSLQYGVSYAKPPALSSDQSVALDHSRTLPGSLADRLALADMNLDTRTTSVALHRAIAELGAGTMRQIQPDGKLTPETVYTALFRQAPPENLKGDDLTQAIVKRCLADEKALLEKLGDTKRMAIDNLVKFIPWNTFTAQMIKPSVVTLDQVSALCDTLMSSEISREGAKNQLLLDPPRLANIFNGQKLPPPTFSFTRDERTVSVQTGRDPDFKFLDDADKAAYQKGEESSLSKRLERFCQEICHPDGSEKQVTNVMSCLSQSAALPLKLVSVMAGTNFDEHSGLSVSLSRQTDGSIKADFTSPTSPPELLKTMGQFTMSLNITKEGAINVTAFELRPPLDVGTNDRFRNALDLAAPFRALDQGQDGLFAQISTRAQALDPQAKLSPELWREMRGEMDNRIHIAAAGSLQPVTQAQILEARTAVLNEFFGKIETVAGKLPPEQRDMFVRGCLELGMVPDEALLPALHQITRNTAQIFGEMLTARSGQEAKTLMLSLNQLMSGATFFDPVFAGKGASFFEPAQQLGVRLGMLQLMNGNSPEAFASALTRPGPFRDMLHLAAHDKTEEGKLALQTHSLFLRAMGNILPEKTLTTDLNPFEIRERDLSLPRQRELLGAGNFITRGLGGVVMPQLAGLNQSLKSEMPAIQEHIRKDALDDLLLGPRPGKGPERGRTDLGLSQVFLNDYNRDGIFVNGRLHHPKQTGTTEQDFINLFPDSYTAGMLSNLAGQNLLGAALAGLVKATDPRTSSALNNGLIGNWGLMAGMGGQMEQNTRIDVLDAAKGLYRISAFKTACAGDPKAGQEIMRQNFPTGGNYDPGLERFMYEVVVDIDLGAPVIGEGPRPEPKLENVRIDILARGREVVLGETE
ncbi:MAG: hypothetical protein FWF99_01955 [Desulfovibrionaceae bacterium]|nr:hypothetical protein [Desulfovibrionaceae bacterium]